MKFPILEEFYDIVVIIEIKQWIPKFQNQQDHINFKSIKKNQSESFPSECSFQIFPILDLEVNGPGIHPLHRPSPCVLNGIEREGGAGSRRRAAVCDLSGWLSGRGTSIDERTKQ
uniref:Uncharacterized protein n=1 Tax=Lygus hesperus TaxID=30085 RepID=A0A146LQW5_LYGHE